MRLMTRVFDYSQARLADRLVLLVIADRSDDDGTGCWRGRDSIARMAGVSQRQVTASIARLVELGELAVVERAGRTNLYRVTLAESATPTLAESASHPGRPPADPLADPASNSSSDTSRPSRTRRRAREGSDPERDRIASALGVAPSRTSLGRDADDVELHYATDTEKARVKGELAGMRERLGMAPLPCDRDDTSTTAGHRPDCEVEQ